MSEFKIMPTRLSLIQSKAEFDVSVSDQLRRHQMHDIHCAVFIYLHFQLLHSVTLYHLAVI